MPEQQDPLEVPVGDNENPERETIMNESIKEMLVMESFQAHQHIMNESKGNVQSSNNLLRHVAVKKFDQVDSIESASVEKVLTAGK